jgi:hypothetical protein
MGIVRVHDPALMIAGREAMGSRSYVELFLVGARRARRVSGSLDDAMVVSGPGEIPNGGPDGSTDAGRSAAARTFANRITGWNARR